MTPGGAADPLPKTKGVRPGAQRKVLKTTAIAIGPIQMVLGPQAGAVGLLLMALLTSMRSGAISTAASAGSLAINAAGAVAVRATPGGEIAVGAVGLVKARPCPP